VVASVGLDPEVYIKLRSDLLKPDKLFREIRSGKSDFKNWMKLPIYFGYWYQSANRTVNLRVFKN
jgi:hypothetical protein